MSFTAVLRNPPAALEELLWESITTAVPCPGGAPSLSYKLALNISWETCQELGAAPKPLGKCFLLRKPTSLGWLQDGIHSWDVAMFLHLFITF